MMSWLFNSTRTRRNAPSCAFSKAPSICGAALAAVALAGTAGPARADLNDQPTFSGQQPTLPQDIMPEPRGKSPVLAKVGIDQKLDQQVPTDLTFRDETGATVQLSDYFNHGKPILLTLVQYNCPSLCGVELNDICRALNAVTLSCGDDFDIVTVSFDSREKPELAAQQKKKYTRSYQRPHIQQGWHFLTGDEDSIKKLTDAVGFRYVYDKKQDQFIHAAGFVVLTPEGKLSRYFYGVDYNANDVRLALEDASGGKIGSVADQILLYCFHYDPTTGKYGLAVRNALRVGGALTLAMVGGFMLVMFRRDRRYALPDKGTDERNSSPS